MKTVLSPKPAEEFTITVGPAACHLSVVAHRATETAAGCELELAPA